MEELDLVESYMGSALDPKKLARKYREEVPEDVRDRVDTLVGIGLSGSLVVPTLARKLGLRWLVVRKQNDGSHSSLPAFGKLGKRWLLVDDFVSSGRTVANALRGVERALDRYDYTGFETEFAGVFQYESHDPDLTFISASGARTRYGPVRSYFEGLERVPEPEPGVEPVTFDALDVDDFKSEKNPIWQAYSDGRSLTSYDDREIFSKSGSVVTEFMSKITTRPTNSDCLAGLPGCTCRKGISAFQDSW